MSGSSKHTPARQLFCGCFSFLLCWHRTQGDIAGSLLLSAVFIAPCPGLLLTRLQETLHQHLEQVNPAYSSGTPCNAGPILALQSSPMGGRGTAARAGKWKEKCTWCGQFSLGGWEGC